MISQAPSDSACDAAAQQAAHVQYYQRVLHRLIDLGVDLVERLAAAGAADGLAAPDVAVGYDRMTRSIRRSISLAHRLGEPAKAAAADRDAGRRAAARRGIIRGVEDAIQREAWGSEAERLRDELAERLDGPDLADDIDHRPVAAIITDICRDLGLAAPAGTRPWQRRTPDDIAILHAQAAATGDSGMAAMRRAAGRPTAPDAAMPAAPVTEPDLRTEGAGAAGCYAHFAVPSG